VGITATVRPEVLDLTLFSFYKHFLHQFGETRLIVNVDPLGMERQQASDVFAVCRRYSSQVVSRCPTQASFSSAVKWCWEQVESAAFLHLEDDWLLKKPIRLEKVFSRLATSDDAASVRFNLSKNPATDPPLSPCLSLNPSIIRKAFIEQALPLFSCGEDPEKQFHKVAALAHWKYFYYGAPGESACVIDIGKKWRHWHDFQKWQPGSPVVMWQKQPSTALARKLFFRAKYKLFMFYWRRVVV
jgi:hypothetical protein